MRSVTLAVPYKMVLSHNVHELYYTRYCDFMEKTVIPVSNQMGVPLIEYWHIAYGPDRIRIAEFAAVSVHVILEMRASERWQSVEERLKQYVIDLHVAIVPHKRRLQLIRPAVVG